MGLPFILNDSSHGFPRQVHLRLQITYDRFLTSPYQFILHYHICNPFKISSTNTQLASNISLRTTVFLLFKASSQEFQKVILWRSTRQPQWTSQCVHFISSKIISSVLWRRGLVGPEPIGTRLRRWKSGCCRWSHTNYETQSQSFLLNKLSSSPPQWALLILAPLC